MSYRLKFSIGWFTLFTMFHAAGTFYLCFVTAMFSPENQFAWYWNPLGMAILSSSVSTNILAPAIFGLPVSGLIGVFLGYLMSYFRKNRLVTDPKATCNPDLVGTPLETYSSHTSDGSNTNKKNPNKPRHDNPYQPF